RAVMPGIEGVFRADRGLAHRIAEGPGERVQSAPTGAVAGDDVGDAKRPQPFDGIGNDSLHDPAEVQPAHDAVDRNVGKEIASMETYIDDARVRARAEYDQSQVAHVRHHYALIHEQRIGFPGRVGTRSREMVDAAFLERRDPRYLPAVIEMAVEQ